jgi:hypothetical protein
VGGLFRGVFPIDHLYPQSNSTSTLHYAGFDPTPDFSQNENGTQPANSGVQRGRLYYGWTKSRWLLLFTNIIVSISQCSTEGVVGDGIRFY